MGKRVWISLVLGIVGSSVLFPLPPSWANLPQTPENNSPDPNLLSVLVELPDDPPPANAIAAPQRGGIQFNLPDGGANPRSTVGGGSRGAVRFGLPSDTQNPNSTVGGGSRGAVRFGLPSDTQNPDGTVGGGSRGSVQFGLPDDAANPRSTVGAGSRGTISFRLPDDRGNPSTVGAGSRGNVRFSLPDNASNPNSTVSGGSRGNVDFRLGDDAKNPESTVGGGSRGDMAIAPLTAILPTTKNGRTRSSHPTIFVYLPPLGTNEVFFSVQDQAGNAHYDAMLTVPAEGGVIAVKIPENAPPLEIEKNYLWYFAPIEKGGRLLPNNYAVTGWIKRVDVAIDETKFQGLPIELATAYAKQGIWYDTLAVLAAAKLNDPNNSLFITEWHDLLEQIELEALATQAIITVL